MQALYEGCSMTEGEKVPADLNISFGSFTFFPARQLLLDAEKPVRIGSRACDILFALLEKQGQVVSKQELQEKVWPKTFVEEGNLRVHVAALRRALGDGHGGKRYINNIPGRGYSFVAPVTTSNAEKEEPPLRRVEVTADMPPILTRMVGRADIVADLYDRLTSSRFISIVGPGGIGKTTVAVAIADRALRSAVDSVCFVDLAPLPIHNSSRAHWPRSLVSGFTPAILCLRLSII